MKKLVFVLLLTFATANLISQTYFDIHFTGTSGVLPQTILVSNLTKGTSVNMQGIDTLRLNVITSVQQVEIKKNKLKIYPSPMEQNCYFEFQNAQQGRVDIQMLTIDGKMMYQSSKQLPQGKHKFLISGVLAGMYVLSVKTASGHITGHFVSKGQSGSVLDMMPITEISAYKSNQNTVEANPLKQNIQTEINSSVVNMDYTLGDKLCFLGRTEGYVNQTIYASPIGSHILTFFLTKVVAVYNPSTGMTWMDRNLGASRVATSIGDTAAFGGLYQWGRETDGHEKRNSNTILTLCNSDQPRHEEFILSGSSPYDWRLPQHDKLWQGLSGTNNPCPEGYRLPTSTELNIERGSWNNNNNVGAFASPLKLPAAGYRHANLNRIFSAGFHGAYWTSTVDGENAKLLVFQEGNSWMHRDGRSGGKSVRCIKEEITNSPPVVETYYVSLISSTTANCAGEVVYNGRLPVTSSGVCWSLIPSPTIEDNKTSDGTTGTGIFTSTITDLTPNTVYYIRAYATNDLGTGYGVQRAFLTLSSGSNDVPIIYNPATDKVWMDRNLGANRVATSSTDYESYGDLFQWGRATDGHEKRNSGQVFLLSNSDNPGHSKFIGNPNNNPWDWRSPQNDNLWQGVNGVNNPCPEGYRLPSIAEWEAELASWSIKNSTGAFGSPLKLPLAGFRGGLNSLIDVGILGQYWSSSVNGTEAQYLHIYSSVAKKESSARVSAKSVRCIKERQTVSVVPSVETFPVTELSSNLATSGGNVSSDGGSSIIVKGICWSISPNPTINNNKTSDGMATGPFKSIITGLTPNTTYYIRAYAINSVGAGYGEEISIITPSGILEMGEVFNPATGKTWLDRNLGAGRVANSSTDAASFGDRYQWGRGTDGHEKQNSPVTPNLSNNDTPNHGMFIVNSMSSPYDWRTPQNNNLWQGVHGVNNPCPIGFRLPTIAEWDTERKSWSSSDASGAFASPLKLTMGGFRGGGSTFIYVSIVGNYWSSTVDGANIKILHFSSSTSSIISDYRVAGRSVRCIKD
jgi:uncharacterized protein (TIGR02145 family)